MEPLQRANPIPDLAPSEAAVLGITDGVFFERFFFPKTVRQAPPSYARATWDLLDNPKARYAAMMIFRGGAKTTRLRLFAAKRIAYALSRTIIYVGKSQDHAIRSIRWLKKQIEFNKRFADTFGLEKGSKWTDEEIEIVHRTQNCTITIVAFGVTGSIRGVNIDDYRPDLIIGDDLCDPENSKTLEQREKIKDLWFSDLFFSLERETECPDAKMVLLGTMLDPNDVTATCISNSKWRSIVVPIVTPEGESAWPERFPMKTINEEREQAIENNKLSLWTREMMCEWIAPEEMAFRPEWFRYYKWKELPTGLHIYMGSDTATSKDRGDFTDFGVYGVDYDSNVYVIDWWYGRKSTDEWIEAFVGLIARHRPLICFGESGLIRNATEGLIRKRMEALQAWSRLEWLPSISDKLTRAEGLLAMASGGKIWLPESAPWLSHVKHSLLGFPSKGIPDDAVDAMSVFVRGLRKVKLPRPKRPAMTPEERAEKVIYLPNSSMGGGTWMR